MTDYDKIVRSFYAGDDVSEEHIEKVKDILKDNVQEQVAPINTKLEAISEKLRDIYKADVGFDYAAESLMDDLPTIVIYFKHDAQYLYITYCFNAKELLNIPVELIVHRLVDHIDDSILKMYKKGSCPNGYIKEKEASNEDN